MIRSIFYTIGQQYADEYDRAEDAWEHAISNNPRIIVELKGMNNEVLEFSADEFGEGFISPWSAEDFSNQDERIEARNNSILHVALAAALKVALHVYVARRNAIIDIDNPNERGTPEHLTLLREYQAAETQIKAWKKAEDVKVTLI